MSTGRLSLSVLLAAVVCSSAYGQGALHLIDHLYQPHGKSPQKTEFSSCWGWVSPSGKEYAFISTYTGTSVVDLNVNPMREIQFIPGPPSSWCYREVKTYRHYAYVVTDNATTGQYVGLQILDLAGLPDTVIHVKDTLYVNPQNPLEDLRTSHSLSYADGYLYCNGSAHWGAGGTVILSLLEDPLSPRLAGAYEPEYLHDTYIRHDTLFGAAIYSGGGLDIVDVKDKSNPTLLAKITYTGSGTHNVWTSLDSKYAFTADEVGTTQHDLKVWALDSLPLSVKVAEWSADPTTSIHNVYGRGHYLYASHYKAGMHVLDIRDPRNPQVLGSYDTYDPPSDTVPGAYAGCWAMFPYFPSGRILGSDMQSGLFLATFDSLKPRVRPGLIYPPDGGFATPEYYSWHSAANQSVDPHKYRLHLFGVGVDTSFTTPDTSFIVPGYFAWIPSGQYTWTVMVVDEFTEVASPDTFHFTAFIEGVADRGSSPAVFALDQNYPNPFNPTTVIRYSLPARVGPALNPPTLMAGLPVYQVSLKVYDILGQVVATLVDRTQTPGTYSAEWKATNASSGMYFYRLSAGNFTDVKKMLILR
jgi:choice-of-anchor B domain-containing protein